ncbi:MAG: UMP kinase [Patescibacteria group bacterium]|nr:UMP kinase [Patescibacteria group bacterium]MDD5490369.1 UMP kinase [Patescibacteria group bacterium]
MPSKKVVISLGGSLVYTKSGIDDNFLRKFRNFIVAQTKRNVKFIIVVGGGVLARNYQEVVRKIKTASDVDLDWAGIMATRANASLVKIALGNLCEDQIAINLNGTIKWSKKVLVAAGWKPGWSTDYDAVYLADKFKIKTVVNLSNVDFIYDKNPLKYKTARPQKELSWREYLKIVGNKWVPGSNLPFDPIASQLGKKKKIRAVFLNGRNFVNLERCLGGKSFKGSVIK